MPTPDFFHSDRLVYRAIPPANYSKPDPLEFIIKKIHHDPSNINASPVIWAPPPPSDDERVKPLWTGRLLSVYICLPVAAGTPGSVPDPAQHATSPPGASPAAAPLHLIPVGMVRLNNVANPERYWHHRKASLSISMSEDYQGKGYGGEALRWIVDWGFRFVGLHRIETSCFSWNQGAGRLYQRIGFVQEGVRRKTQWGMGAWHDVIEFGLLDEEFWALDWVKDKDVREGDAVASRILACQ